jgi:outer membrane protein OmpA-like peptidoglycan-associated protein
MKGLYQRFSLFGLILMVLVTVSGCATKKYVRDQLGRIDPQIAEVKADVTQLNERIDAVNRTAQSAGASAAAADQKATTALQAAGGADSKSVAAQREADAANAAVQQANNRMNAIESRLASFDSYTAGETQMVMFKVNSDALSDEAKQNMDAIANSVSGQQSGYLVEIQGFTDSTGSERYNVNLSQRRAENTLSYLVSKGVPLHRIYIIGLGEERPVAPNNNAGGRQQNRRAEDRIMKSGSSSDRTN